MARGEHAPVTAATGVRPAVEDGAVRAPRVIEQRRGLPGSRAVVGGLLMAVAAIGVFAAYTDATSGSGAQVVVAVRDLRVGHVIDQADLRAVAAELPRSARSAASHATRRARAPAVCSSAINSADPGASGPRRLSSTKSSTPWCATR